MLIKYKNNKLIKRSLHSADHRSRGARQISLYFYVVQSNFLHYRALAWKFLVVVEVKLKNNNMLVVESTSRCTEVYIKTWLNWSSDTTNAVLFPNTTP